MKFLPFIFASTLFLGCLSPDVKPDEMSQCGPSPSQEEAIKDIRTYITEGLKDPDSARFRKVVVVSPVKRYRGLVNGGGYMFGWAIAFEVNAKNSYGGYTGWQPHEIIACPDGTVHWSIQ